MKSLWRRPDVRLAGILALAGVVVLLFNMDTGAQTVSVRNPAQRKQMPNLKFRDLSGGVWTLDDQRGKVILINVWASWCPPCRQETPALVTIANDYRGKPFEIVGASMDESTDPIRRFIDDFHVSYTVVVPPEDSPISRSVDALPTSFLVDRQGRVARVYMGAISEKTLRADIDRLLAES